MTLVARSVDSISYLCREASPLWVPGTEFEPCNVWSMNQQWAYEDIPMAVAPPFCPPFAEQKRSYAQNDQVSLVDINTKSELVNIAEATKNSARLLVFAIEEAHQAGYLNECDRVAELLEDSLVELATHYHADTVVRCLLKCGTQLGKKKTALKLICKSENISFLLISPKGSRTLRCLIDEHGKDGEVMSYLVFHIEENFLDIVGCTNASHVINSFVRQLPDDTNDFDNLPGAPCESLHPFGAEKIRTMVLDNALLLLRAGRAFHFTLSLAVNDKDDAQKILDLSNILDELENASVHVALLRSIALVDPRTVLNLYDRAHMNPAPRFAALLRQGLRIGGL